MSATAELHEILRSIFGFSGFRTPQLEIMEGVVAGESILAILPTGFGKSLCYQIPARWARLTQAKASPHRSSTVLVISPLIALMKDQVDQARARGIKATFINSSLGAADREKRQSRLARGDYEICYITPERFRKIEFWAALENIHIPFLAVDEAHCIAEWGHDFRPDYTRLREFKERLELGQGSPLPVLATTATATPEVQDEIRRELGYSAASMKLITGDLARPRLALELWTVHSLDEKVRALVALRFQTTGAMVVYASLIGTLKKISEALVQLGLPHLFYHGDLNASERRRVQNEFFAGTSSQSLLLLATPAFGLGVDKADIRTVVHVEFPRSLESYFQEAGRGGRDDQAARAVLLYDEDDAAIQMDFIKWANPEPEYIRHVYALIEAHPARVAQEGIEYLRAQMNFHHRRDFRVETSLQVLERWGAIEKKLDGSMSALREPTGDWLSPAHHAERLKHQNLKLLAVLKYAQNRSECRQQLVLKYLGQAECAPCKICDVCRGTEP